MNKKSFLMAALMLCSVLSVESGVRSNGMCSVLSEECDVMSERLSSVMNEESGMMSDENGNDVVIAGPDGRLMITVLCDRHGDIFYTLLYNGCLLYTSDAADEL